MLPGVLGRRTEVAGSQRKGAWREVDRVDDGRKVTAGGLRLLAAAGQPAGVHGTCRRGRCAERLAQSLAGERTVREDGRVGRGDRRRRTGPAAELEVGGGSRYRERGCGEVRYRAEGPGHRGPRV